MNASPASSPNVRFIGVGHAGLAMLEALAARLGSTAACVAINTEAAADGAAGETLALEPRALAGLGTGGDPERGRELAEARREQLKAVCDGAEVVMLLTGLGRGTGSGATPVVAQVAKESGALVLAVAALPFAFEGGRRQRQAERALERLQEFADGVIAWPNESVFQFVNDRAPVAAVLRDVNTRIADSVAGLWRLLTQRGLLDVSLADVCAALRGSAGEAFLASAEAAGETRAATAVEQLLAHPLLAGGANLEAAGTVLVGIAAGGALTMSEVSRVMEAVNCRCGEAQVFVGAAEDAALGDRLRITLLLARGAVEAAGPAPAAVAPPRAATGGLGMEVDTEFVRKPAAAAPRGTSRFKAPAPELPADRVQQLAARRGKGRKSSSRMRQEQLPLQLISKGRFEQVEPTLLDGEDLDVPTFVRRNMVFN